MITSSVDSHLSQEDIPPTVSRPSISVAGILVCVPRFPGAVFLLLWWLISVLSWGCSRRSAQDRVLENMPMLMQDFRENCPVTHLFEDSTPSGVLIGPDDHGNLVISVYGVSQNEQAVLIKFVSFSLQRLSIRVPVVLQFYSKGTRTKNKQSVSSENLINEVRFSAKGAPG